MNTCIATGYSSARNKDQKLVGHFFENRIFSKLLTAIPLKMYRKFGPPNFGRPNAEIGWKMANGRLLFLALLKLVHYCVLLSMACHFDACDHTLVSHFIIKQAVKLNGFTS